MDKQPTRKIVPIIICGSVIVLLLAVILYIGTRGRLDNSNIGILEFRILPTRGDLQLSDYDIDCYIESMRAKGPGYTSSNKYVWCEIKNFKEWSVPNSIVGRFDDKYYVLASNQPDKVLLHSIDGSAWRLRKARLQTDNLNRRTIDFVLDKNGEKLIAKITGNNIGRPLCILIDGFAISAPSIETGVQKIHCVWPN